jgi:hypothetical protein
MAPVPSLLSDSPLCAPPELHRQDRPQRGGTVRRKNCNVTMAGICRAKVPNDIYDLNCLVSCTISVMNM